MGRIWLLSSPPKRAMLSCCLSFSDVCPSITCPNLSLLPSLLRWIPVALNMCVDPLPLASSNLPPRERQAGLGMRDHAAPTYIYLFVGEWPRFNRVSVVVMSNEAWEG